MKSRKPESVPTLDEAIKLVDERGITPDPGIARDPGWVRFAAKRIVRAAEERNRKLAREQANEERRQREWAEIVATAKKVWKQLWGEKVAKQIDPEARYWLLRADQSLYAFASRERVAEAKRILEPTHRVEIVGARGSLSLSRGTGGTSSLDADEGIPAVNLGVTTERLAMVINDVDPDGEKLTSIAAGKRKAEQASEATKAESDRKRRKREYEERTFGISVE